MRYLLQLRHVPSIVHYISDLTLADCTESVNSVLTKREVHNAIITGIQLDILAEKKRLMDPLQHIIEDDEGLYGIDEILALSIVNVYDLVLCSIRSIFCYFSFLREK